VSHKDHLVTHVALLLDGSSSMRTHAKDLIKVADDQIAYMARRSKEMNQEWRVSVYMFADTVTCLIWDMDVLRLPSIASLYHAQGNTALVHATMECLRDLRTIPQKYGNQSFLTYVLTDGEDNRAQAGGIVQFQSVLNGLAENETVAALVPNIIAKDNTRKYGFPKDNISVWDPNADSGVGEAMEDIRAATDAYMVSRASGLKGTRTLFSTAPDAVNADAIKAAGLKPLDPKAYMLVPVTKPREPHGVLNRDKHRVWEISGFARHATGNFTVGSVYYQLSKKEKIGGNKDLAVLELATSRVFTGGGVRAMIGLPDADASVAPDFNPAYQIYVQSQSTNRHLVPGTKLLVLK